MVILPALLLAVGLLGWPAQRSRRRAFVGCLQANQVLAFVVIGCWVAGWHTEGEVLALKCPIFMFPIYIGTTVLGVCRAFKPATMLALATAVGCTLYNVPTLIELVTRLVRLEREVVQIRQYLDVHHQQNGEYPRKLSGYTFARPELTPHVRYQRDGSGFRVDYDVVDSHISHWYSSKSGWGYYPD
jgi:hypothetical protein